MLLVHNKTSNPITLAGTSLVVPASGSLNVTSELRDKTVSQKMALENQRGTALKYSWAGPKQYDLYPLKTEQEQNERDMTALRNELNETTTLSNHLWNRLRMLSAGMSGDIVLSAGEDKEVSADDLNAAAAGTFKKTFVATLRTSKGEFHDWAGSAVILSGEAVVDGDIDAPVVTPSSPKWDMGRLLVTATFDTDAGATKTYIADDELTVTVKVASDDKLLGFTVTPAVVTFTIV